MHNHEIQTIAIFSAQYKNIEDAENAGALYSVDIEYPMTLNDLSRLCDSIAEAVGVPGGSNTSSCPSRKRMKPASDNQ
ncbi:hypothetical protein [Enterobacter hormaechei]|uniref:hypothetical protein n=1 Tax=Enterobacter hormaechei TaxID=158836 RepID=UPI003F49FBE4